MLEYNLKRVAYYQQLAIYTVTFLNTQYRGGNLTAAVTRLVARISRRGMKIFHYLFNRFSLNMAHWTFPMHSFILSNLKGGVDALPPP